jgi:quercetin dioxygenase-like cupin family protein
MGGSEAVAGATRYPWRSGWTAQDPLRLHDGYVPARPGCWGRGFREYLEYRDLGLAAASGGGIGADHIRVIGEGELANDWHSHDIDFQFVFVLGGTMTMQNEHGGRHVLRAGDAYYQPGCYRHREYDFSGDYEVIQIHVPMGGGTGTTVYGRDAPLPERAATLDPARRGVFTPAAAPGDAGERFRVTDLGTAGPTEGRIAMRRVQALAAGTTDGRHEDAASRFVVVLRGSARLEADGDEPLELAPLDAVSLGPRPGSGRGLGAWSSDLAFLELSLPAADPLGD